MTYGYRWGLLIHLNACRAGSAIVAAAPAVHACTTARRLPLLRALTLTLTLTVTLTLTLTLTPALTLSLTLARCTTAACCCAPSPGCSRS